MKVVDTKAYVSLMRELTEEGKEVCIVITGNSMSPFLVHQRDLICLKKTERKLRKGDMVFYQRQNGQYVMHRIFKVRPDGYYIVGDAQREIEGPISEEQIFGLITKVRRKDRWIGPGDFWWEFLEHVWIRVVPFRRYLSGLYGWITKKRG